MGIALRPSDPAFTFVSTYYAVAKREPTRRGDLEIAGTSAFKFNFLDLVKVLADKQQSHVVIATHGSSDGISMPLTDKTTDDADNKVLKDLVSMVDDYPNLSHAKVSLFAKGYTVPESQVMELVTTCFKVRKHQSNCVAVHIRGCNIGKTIDNLLTIRKLFDSTVVSAPNCPMLYASFAPEWSRPSDKNVGEWISATKAHTRRREFWDPPAKRSRMVLDVDYAGTTSSAQGVIEHANDLAKWADAFYGNTSHGTQHSMPIAAMWPESGYFLPHESGYVDQLEASRKG